MPDASDAEPPVVHVRLRRGLLGLAMLTGFLATSPLFAVLYWFTIPTGTWPMTLLAHVVAFAVSIVLAVRERSIFTEVRDRRLRGNGIFSPMETIDLARIARVDIVHTYVGLSPAPVQQLLVRDADGRRLFRMRGNFWHDGDIDEVAAALPVDPERVTEPIDLRDFFRRYPGSAYWFENKPPVTIAGIVIGVLALAAIAASAMMLAGEAFG